MRPLTLDFETYYSDAYTLKKLTTEAYVRDPQFQVIGVGVLDESDGETAWFEDHEFWEWAQSIDWADVSLLAHHAHFDGLILNHHYNIRPGHWRCTLSMSRAAFGYDAGGSLEKLATRFGFPPKGTEVLEAKNKQRRDFTPDEWARYGAYCVHDCEIAAGVFEKLAPEFPESELQLIDMTVRMFTEPHFRVDAPKLEAYVLSEETRKAALLARVVRDSSELASNPKFAAILQSLDIEPPKKISPRTGEETFAFAKSDSGMQELLESPRDEVRWLAEARVAIKSTINETRSRRLLSAASRGPVPVYLKYSGAHTHRFSGGDRLNFQNFQRGGEIRDAILAPPGHVVVASDSGQIEARKVAWLAGQDDLVQAFAENRDIYSEFASEAYGRPVTKEDKVERGVGKQSILGLGYSMGWQKFALACLAGPMGASPVQFATELCESLGLNVSGFLRWAAPRVHAMKSRLTFDALAVHCCVAHHFVGEYRLKYSHICELWKDMDEVIAAMECGAEEEIAGGLLKIERHALRLPNGMRLHYPGLAASEEGGFSYLGGRARTERVRLYGGMMTENVVQALARIVICDQALAVFRETGIRPVTTTHDELVYCVPEEDGTEFLNFVLTEMHRAPAWAPGLPLKAEGGLGKSYGEAK